MILNILDKNKIINYNKENRVKTLSKSYTLGTFFDEDQENYFKLRKHWSNLVNSEENKKLTLGHHILYLILLGKDWTKAFTLPTNSNKVANNYKPKFYSFRESCNYNYYKQNLIKMFDGVVSSEVIDRAFSVANFSGLYAQNAYKDQ
jgi:hypothetical protein